MIAKINIVGHIGPSTVGQTGLNRGVDLIDVIEQVESLPDATELQISINSPGGYADIGDSIYDYLVSQKAKGKKVTTIQTGLIGSIATKIFLAGDERIVDDRYDFWIHNPYLDKVSGDQDQLREMAKSLEETEKGLRKFYAEFTNISDEGLDALMKRETGLTADQCIKFGFGTNKKLIPAFNSIKMNKEKSFLDHVGNFFKSEKKAVQPKAQIPTNDKKNMVVTLADGNGSFWVEADALAEGVPAFALDEAGEPTSEPVADGDYVLDDGTTVSILDGLVSAVMPMEEASQEPTLEQKIQEAVDAALAKKDEAHKAELEKLKKEVEEGAQAKILALKKDMKIGVQPKKAYLGNPVADETKPKRIHQIMAEREEKRRQQFNIK